ncbi:MAG: type II toxin-antitoxin system RelE family toxin [Methylobacter sp.]
MNWIINVEARAAKTLKTLDKPTKQRIAVFIDQLGQTDNPRNTGKALQGRLKGLWRYRVGDYRLICQIKDGELIILLLEIGHRKEVYR